MLPCDLKDMLSLRFDGYAGLRYNIPEDEIGSLTLKNAGEVEKPLFFCQFFFNMWYNSVVSQAESAPVRCV
jgi:hypothetical protein